MCLAVPGEVMACFDDRGTPMGRISIGSITKDVCLALVPEAGVGDYVVVHAGVAIAVLDTEAAQEAIDLFIEMAAGSEP